MAVTGEAHYYYYFYRYYYYHGLHPEVIHFAARRPGELSFRFAEMSMHRFCGMGTL